MSTRDPSNHDIDTTRIKRTDLVDLLGAIHALVSVVQRGNELSTEAAETVNLNAKRFARQVLVQLFVVFVILSAFAALLGNACVVSGRLGEVTAQLDETTRLLEAVRVQGEKTARKIEDVKTDVAEVQATQPTIELRASDAGAGRPQAAIVVRPRAAKPPVTASAGAPPEPPAISIPVALPQGSKAIVEDGGK